MAEGPDPDEPLNHPRSDRLNNAVIRDNVAGVSLSLQQARNDLDVPYCDGTGLVLKAYILPVIW